MTTPHRTLLQQALDALRQCEFTSPPAQRPIVKDAITALREALAAPPAAPADDHATPSGGQEAGPQEDRIEAAYWRFDARHKGYSQWKTAPMSERDAFKAEMRNALESEKVRAEMRLVARGWRRPDAPAAPASQWMPIETAPKDGALFLCWVDAVRCGETDEGQQYEEDVSQLDFCYWRTQSDTPDGGWFDPCCGQIGDRQRVTHWMPLPAAPDHLRDVAEKVAPAAAHSEPLTSDQEKALSAEAKTGPFQHTTPIYGNDMQSGETPGLSSKRHAGSTPPAAPIPDGMVMVPREPTQAMCAAAVVFANGNAVYKNVLPEVLKLEEEIYGEVWSAMIAASPAAPVVPNGCEKIFTHKWLDPDCIEQGCKSLAAHVVPLTDEQIRSMWKSSEFRGNGGQVDWFCEGIRAAEAHHGITGASK